MTGSPPDWAAYVRVMQPVTGIGVAEDWAPAVARNLAMAAAAAALFADLPLDDVRDEAAPVFQPGRQP
jgi:hypothetical protein